MTDTTGTEQQLTVDDILNEANEAGYHTILEVWREVLKPAHQERSKTITPQWANRITSSYRELNFRDMGIFRERYFDKVLALLAVLEIEIAGDDECLNLTTPEEDAEINAVHYFNVLINWQKTLLTWELDWDYASPFASAEIAAISEVHRMFFSDTGLTSLLDQINFQFPESAQMQLAAELQEMRAAQEEQ